MHQNTRCVTGAAIWPPAVIVSITKLRESDEVANNIAARMIPVVEVFVASGLAIGKTKGGTQILAALWTRQSKGVEAKVNGQSCSGPSRGTG